MQLLRAAEHALLEHYRLTQKPCVSRSSTSSVVDTQRRIAFVISFANNPKAEVVELETQTSFSKDNVGDALKIMRSRNDVSSLASEIPRSSRIRGISQHVVLSILDIVRWIRSALRQISISCLY